MRIRRIALALVLLLCATVAHASQNSVVLSTSSPYPGLQMLNDANSAFNTLITNNSGASAPSTCYNNMFWVDTTNSLVKWTPDCTNWLPVGGFASGKWDAISGGTTTLAPSSTGSSNAYVVTYSPVPAALVVGRHYPFIANFQNTTAATENVNSIGAKSITKNGAVALASGDITNGMAVDDIWDGTEFQLTGQIANVSLATVTSVGSNNGICGGPVTASGTLGLCSQTGPFVLGNTTTGVPGALSMTSLTSILNVFSSSLQGLVPASGGGTTNFLRADGTFAPPPQGAFALLKTINCTGGSPCTTVTFDNTVINGSYPHYIIYYDTVLSASSGAGVRLIMQVSTGSYLTSGYTNNSVSGSCSGTTQLSIMCNGTAGASVNPNAYARGSVEFSNINAGITGFNWMAQGGGASGISYFYVAGGGINSTTSAIQGVQISAGGTPFTGNFSLFSYPN